MHPRWARGLPVLLLLSLMLSPANARASSAASRAAIENGLRIIEANYLFETELQPGRLLGSALDSVESAITRAHAFEISPNAYVLESGDCRLHLEVIPTASLTDLADPLTAAADLVEQCISDPPKGMPSAAALLLGGLLTGLDPYSTVFDSRGRQEHTIQFSGKLAGIGARIGSRHDTLTLITVYPDSPAARAGLRDDDQVTRIDGVSTINMMVSDAVDRIRGDIGTEVVLTILRENDDEAQEISVTRGLVLIPSVEAKLLDSGNIYASISHFSQTTPQDFRSHVEALLGTNPRRGIIIDVRANSGGSMLGSSAIADAFLDEGLLITTAGRQGEPVSGLTGSVYATSATPFHDCPAVILTSPRTASGSELMAAGMRNHDRAVFIGQPTYGKGTVQKTYALGAKEALKLTVGNFLPKGLAIPTDGLIPDIEIQTLVKNKNGFVLMTPRRPEEDREFWQRNPDWLEEEPARIPLVLPFFKDVTDEQDREENEETPGEIEFRKNPLSDPAVAVADELLARHGSTSAKTMLTDAAVFLEERATRARSDIEQALEAFALDWTQPAIPKQERYADEAATGLTVEWNPAKNTLRGGETTEIEMRVTNPSSVPLYRLRAVLDSDTVFLRGLALPIGQLKGGETLSRTIPVHAPADLRLARLTATVILETDDAVVGRYGPFSLFADEGDLPNLAHRASVSRGDEPDVLEIRIEIANRGTTPAGEIRLQLAQPEIGTAELLEGATTFPALQPGETVDTLLHVKLLEKAAEAQSVSLYLYENEHRIFLDSKLSLAESDGVWREAPRIELERIERTEAENTDLGYDIVARVSDDAGLVEIRTEVDGDRVGFFDMSSQPAVTRRVMLPWPIESEPKRYEIVAKDTDGLVARYVTNL